MAERDRQFTVEQMRNYHDIMKKGREGLHLSQEKIAKMTGISQTTVSNLERGPYQSMSALDLFTLLKLYGIQPNTIAGVLGFYNVTANPEQELIINQIRKLFEEIAPDRRQLTLNAVIALIESFSKK